jgi:hypothetical protein
LGSVEYKKKTIPASKGQAAHEHVAASAADTHNAEQLVEHLKDVMKEFDIHYAGCAGGEDCAHSSGVHTHAATRHCAFAGVTDSGGSDPRASAMFACNALRCFPHGIQTCYKSTVEEKEPEPDIARVVDLINKVVSTVRYYRASTKMMDAFLTVQLDALRSDLTAVYGGVKIPHRLLRACITRWGSTYDMLKRFFEPVVQHAFFAVAAGQTDENPAAVSSLPVGEDKTILQDILLVLTPLKIVTVLMQGEKYVTLSAVYPELCNIAYDLEDMAEGRPPRSDPRQHELHPVARSFAKKLGEALSARVTSTFLRPASLIATAVDPRFKRLRLIDPQSHRDAWKYVLAAMEHEKVLGAREAAAAAASEAALAEAPDADVSSAAARAVAAARVAAADEQKDHAVPDNRVFPDPRPDRVRFSSRWQPSPDERGIEERHAVPGRESAAEELARYRLVTPEDSGYGDAEGRGGGIPTMEVDPCAFWKTRAKEFPLLNRVARKYLSIPAASAAAERMFSYTGLRVGKLNANLDDEALLCLMQIRAFTAFIDKWGSKYGS